jgi:hypothetical protein
MSPPLLVPPLFGPVSTNNPTSAISVTMPAPSSRVSHRHAAQRAEVEAAWPLVPSLQVAGSTWAFTLAIPAMCLVAAWLDQPESYGDWRRLYQQHLLISDPPSLGRLILGR